MRKLLLVSFALCMVFNTSAQTKKQPKSKALPVIDVTKDYPKKEITLKDYVTTEFIPLETTDDVLLDNLVYYRTTFTDHYIATCNRQDGTIFVFDRAGKIKHHFNRKGQSGEEYIYIFSLRIDEKAKELYLLDGNKVLVYSFEGNFKRRLPVPRDIRISKMYIYDDQSLICYDSYDLDRTGKVPNDCPYFLMSKKDGTISRLPITIKNRIGNMIYTKDTPEMTSTYSMTASPMVSNGTEFILSDLAGDTVYLFKNKKITPLFVRTPKSAETDPRVMFYCDSKVGNYLFMSAIPKRMYKDSERIKAKTFVFDLSTGEIYGSLEIMNADTSNKRPFMIDNCDVQLPENCTLECHDSERLLKAYKESKLTGKLKEIASKMTEDDNPVFALSKFNLK